MIIFFFYVSIQVVWLISSELGNKYKVIPMQQAVEAYWVERSRGFHIFKTTGSQIEVRLSALRADRPLSQEDCWYSFLLEAESTPRTIM
jgi:hypothetical protein